MSGFFMLDRRFLDETVHDLSSISFKILVDLLSSSRRPVRLKELPYRFRMRLHGESKLDTNALIEYLFLVADKTVGRFIPVRFVMFGLAGFVGVAVHLALLSLLILGRHTAFLTAQATATIAAMLVNYVVNNEVTYRDRRRRGLRFWRGLALFVLACSLGAVSNFAIASFAYAQGFPWFLAALLGLMISSVWNFSVTSVLTWREERRLSTAAALKSQQSLGSRAAGPAENANGPGDYHPISS
jgi:dolichol-phosphate mannosyltransferase